MNRIIGFVNVSKSILEIYIKKNNLQVVQEEDFLPGFPWVFLNNPQNHSNYQCNIILQVSHNFQIPIEIRHKTEYIHDLHDSLKKKPNLYSYIYFNNMFLKKL